MLPRTAHPLTLGATAVLSEHPVPSGRWPRRARVASTEVLRVAVRPDTRPEPPVDPVARIDLSAAPEQCVVPRPQIVCADDASCICPLSGHVTDAERVVMNDIAAQASRLATALAWIFAVVALASLVLLVLR